MKDWYVKNQMAIASDGLISSLSISSWAIVVDLTWKKAFTAVRTKDSTNDANVAPTGAALTNGNY